MTEQAWLICTDPDRMLNFLRRKASDRKFRLFAVACCRRILCLVTDQRAKYILEVAERLADELATNAERRAAAVGINDPQAGGTAALAGWGAVCCTVAVSAGRAAERSSEGAASAFGFASTTVPYAPTYEDDTAHFVAVREGTEKERIAQTPLLRDIFGPLLFRPMLPVPAWLSWNDSTIRKLAQAIYDDRACDRMPILADALEEAGCDNADILNHCRQPGEHVRGCWVVDLLLNKS